MPLIEVIATAREKTTPGYAYVADTGHDPSKAALNPTSRKRTARSSAVNAAFSSTDLTSRQATALIKNFAELERDNHKDVQIPLPSREKRRTVAGKMTPAVRKILQSQKTFANHLADEEALLALERQKGGGDDGLATTTAVAKAQRQGRPSKTPMSRRKPSNTAAATKQEQPVPGDLDVATPDAVAPLIHHAQQDPSTVPFSDEHPLLRIEIPCPPSPRTIQKLVSSPLLPYAEAQVGLPALVAAPRQFCEICGYWGRVKCIKCGARVCGLECKRTHDESRCNRFYA